MSTESTDPIGKYVGKYRILQRVHRGGMGVIYLAAEDSETGHVVRHVIIKKILPHLSDNEEFVNLFHDEMGISAQLMFPNIVQIYNFGKDLLDGTFYLVMEYVQGLNLRELLKQCSTLKMGIPKEIACFIVSEVCRALEYAHKKKSFTGEPLNIIHRDISPDNIMISWDGDVKILDFGVAKARGRITETVSGQIKGKYSYMSPEQVSNKPIDGRSDIFSLGVVFFELLTGKNFFRDETDIATIANIAHKPIAPPSSINKAIDSRIDQMAMTSMERDVSKRYPTARDFFEDIHNYLKEGAEKANSYRLAAFLQTIKEQLATEPAPPATPETQIYKPPAENVPEEKKQAEPVKSGRKLGWAGMAAAILLCAGAAFLFRNSLAGVVGKIPMADKVIQQAMRVVGNAPPAATPASKKSEEPAAENPPVKEPGQETALGGVPATPSPAEPAPAADAPPPETAEAAAAAPAPANAESPTLTISSNPRTTILIDGKSVGLTPKVIPINAGKRVIKLVDAKCGIKWQTDLDAVAGKPYFLWPSFTGTLNIDNSGQADIFINGQPFGNGKSISAKVPAGNYSIFAVKDADVYQTFPGVVKMDETKSVAVEIKS